MSWINLLDIIYPVGSIYCSTLTTSPAELLGGSWTKIEEAVLRSSDDAFGYTGADSHAMTVEEMPNHTHGAKLTAPLTDSHNGGNYWPANWVENGSWNRAYNEPVGGARNVSCPTFVQLQYVVSNRLVSPSFGEVI